jgi:branched-chain amino acid transport system ATP-binding protein
VTPADEDSAVTPVLELRHVTAGYGRAVVLRDVSVCVQAGSVVALVGPNGAGKTTLLRVAAGLVSPAAGDVLIAGRDVTGSPADERARHGLCLVPERRGIFPNLSVRDNLRLAVPSSATDRSLDPAFDVFPELSRRLGQRAGTMSGGQQQMLALARCFLADPKVALLDEVSTGLAPRTIDLIFAALARLVERGVALLLVEQYIARALELADVVNQLERGVIVAVSQPSELDRASLMLGYMGGGREVDRAVPADDMRSPT